MTELEADKGHRLGADQGGAQPRTPLADPRHRLGLLATLAICGVYLLILGPRDWIPHDDGAIAHAAERVLHGEIPHRDFNEPYTGGLTFIHAAAMQLFGTNLLTLRWVLLVATLGFLAAQYRLAARIASPMLASLATLLAFAWSLPNYFVSMPSWYNLFFATFGTLAMFRYREDRNQRWLVLAGVVGGFSILCKIVGLYYFAAVFLVLLFLEFESIGRSRSSKPNFNGFVVVCLVGLIAFASIVLLLISNRFTALSFLLFIVPSVVVALLVGSRALNLATHNASEHLISLFSKIGIVCVSGAAIIGLYLIVHIATGSLDAFWSGTVGVIARRLDYSGGALPGIATAAYALPFVALFGWPAPRRGVREPWVVMGSMGVAGLALVLRGDLPVVYDGVWNAMRPLVPILVVAACWSIHRSKRDEPSYDTTYLFILAAMTSLLGLVQFPFSGGVYFCYVAPMIVLLGLFIVRMSDDFPVHSLAIVVAVLAGFAIVWLHTGSTYLLGYRYQRVHANVPLDLERGGIKVRERDALLYGEMIGLIQQHTIPGDAIYASPDMPEVYFLSERQNPTRTFFEGTNIDYEDPDAMDARIIAELEAADVAFAVLGGRSEFARPPSPKLMKFLHKKLPNEERMAGYMLRWREEPSAKSRRQRVVHNFVVDPAVVERTE